MPKTNVNGVDREMTPEEVTEHEAIAARIDIKMAARDAEDAQLATDKANAKAKLIAGEALTEAEADTIVL